MSGEAKNRFSVTQGTKSAERERDRETDVGHYFEQGILERHQSLLAARAETLALTDELIRLGVQIDPETGEVTVRRA